MNVKEAVQELTDATNDSFCVTLEIWRHAGEDPEVSWRIWERSINGESIYFPELHQAVERAVQLLNAQRRPVTDSPSVNEAAEQTASAEGGAK